MKKLIIVSVSYGGGEYLSKEAVRQIEESSHIILRTARMDIAAWLRVRGLSFSSMDSLYDTYGDFDQLLTHLGSLLWKEAETSDVTYLVPDILTDSSVRTLFLTKPADASIKIVSGSSFPDVYSPLILPFLGRGGLYINSASGILDSSLLPDQDILITEIDNPVLAGHVKLHLCDYFSDMAKVYFMRDAHHIAEIRLYEADRQRSYNHQAALFIPGRPVEQRESIIFSDLPYIAGKRHCVGISAPQKGEGRVRPPFQKIAGQIESALQDNDYDALSVRLGQMLYRTLEQIADNELHDELTMSDVLFTLHKSLQSGHPYAP